MGTIVFLEAEMIASTFFVIIIQIFEVISFPQTSEPTYPSHASCRIDWIVPTSCDKVRIQIINQMNQWKGDTNCGKLSDLCPTMPCGKIVSTNSLKLPRMVLFEQSISPR